MTYIKSVNAQAKSTGSYYPRYKDNLSASAISDLRLDTAGNLITRSVIFTDEGSNYEPFSGSTLGLVWTELKAADATITTGSSICSLNAGVTATNETAIYRGADYAPLNLSFILNVSQRIANQDIYFGYGDNPTAPSSDTMFARFHLYGISNTVVSCETQSSADSGGGEGLNTQIIIPYGLNTSQNILYKIINDARNVKFYIGTAESNLILLASHNAQIPNPYTAMYQRVRIKNGTTPATATLVNIDTITLDNYNEVDIRGNVTGNVNIAQNVIADVYNSSSTNLATGNGYAFTGRVSSTLSVAGIQVSLFADKNCSVSVQQSPDGNNWDIVDNYNYYASTNFGITVQAVSSYYRVVVTSASLTTGTFRLQTALCPIVEALPRSLSSEGYLMTKSMGMEDDYGFETENTPMGEMRVAIPTRLVGAQFDGTTIDPNFWLTSNITNGSSVQGNADITITSGSIANGSASVYSARRARYVSGNANQYRSVVTLSGSAVNNKRRWGVGYGATMPTITDGAWFQLDGGEFSVNTKVASGADSKVTAFNGKLGATYTPGSTVKTYEMYWTNSKVYFVIGNQLLHTYSADNAPWTSTMNLYIFMDNANSSGAATINTLDCRVASIRRLGPLQSQPISFYHAGQTSASGIVLKYSSGNLQGLAIGGVINNNATITLYDSASGSGGGNIIWASGAMSSQTFYSLDFKGLPFYNGLSMTKLAQNSNATVIYE